MNQALGNPKEKLITPYNILLVVAFCYDSLFDFATVIFRRLPVIGVLGGYVMPAVVVALVLLNLFAYKTVAVHTYDLLLSLLLLFILGVSFLLFPKTQPYYNTHNLNLVFFKAIPFLFIGSNFTPKKTTVKVLTCASYLAIVVNAAYIFYYKASRDASDYNMHYAYLMLIHVLFAVHGLFNKELGIPTWVRFVFFALGALFIISMGTRGPILIVLAYLVVVIVLDIVKRDLKKAILPVIILVALTLYISFAYLDIIQWLRELIANIGLSTRALDMLLEGEYVSATSGRDRIYELLWEKLREAPLGYGIFGEWQFVNYSAHSISLQICMYCGLFPGSILIAFLLGMVAWGYFSVRNKYARDMIMMFLVFTVVRNFFGGEFFSDYVFFLIGLSLQCITNRKKINSLENTDA